MYGTTNLRGYTAGGCYPLPVDEYIKKACHCLCLKEVWVCPERYPLSHSILQSRAKLVSGLNSCKQLDSFFHALLRWQSLGTHWEFQTWSWASLSWQQEPACQTAWPAWSWPGKVGHCRGGILLCSCVLTFCSSSGSTDVSSAELFPKVWNLKQEQRRK